MRILAFGHLTDTGKSQCQRFAMAHFRTAHPKLKVVKANFGDYLKNCAYNLFKNYGLQQASFYDTDAGRAARTVDLPLVGKTPLQLWIDFGNFIHSIGEWIQYDATINSCVGADVVVIGDMRRLYEANAIVDGGGRAVCVERVGREPISNIDRELIGWTRWTDRIWNTEGDLQSLNTHVRAICDDFA